MVRWVGWWVDGWMDGAQFIVHESYRKVCNNMYPLSLYYLYRIALQALCTSVRATNIIKERTASILTDTVKIYCYFI